MEGQWLSISEYSQYRDVSVSTIRRYIKADRVKSKLEDGKYYIYVSDENYSRRIQGREKEELKMRLEILELKARIKTLEEEKNDLRMLVDLYEGGGQPKEESNTFVPPELPRN